MMESIHRSRICQNQMRSICATYHSISSIVTIHYGLPEARSASKGPCSGPTTREVMITYKAAIDGPSFPSSGYKDLSHSCEWAPHRSVATVLVGPHQEQCQSNAHGRCQHSCSPTPTHMILTRKNNMSTVVIL